VTLLLWAPRPHDGGDWECPFRIVGLERHERVRVGIGVDGFQALFLAMTMMAALLYTSREYEEGRLLFDPEAGKRSLLLPAHESISDLLPEGSFRWFAC
jgi:hypothetical protein